MASVDALQAAMALRHTAQGQVFESCWFYLPEGYDLANLPPASEGQIIPPFNERVNGRRRCSGTRGITTVRFGSADGRDWRCSGRQWQPVLQAIDWRRRRCWHRSNKIAGGHRSLNQARLGVNVEPAGISACGAGVVCRERGACLGGLSAVDAFDNLVLICF